MARKLSKKTEARTWEMWAHELTGHDGKPEYHHCSSDKWWVEIHGLPHPICRVILTESQNGKFLGWIEKHDTEPVMIWHEKIFEICFAYGSKVEVKAGKGEVVRLEIKKAT